MSIAQQFFREMRPLFRMLEEPLGRSPAYFGSRHHPIRPLLDDPFFHSAESLRPAVDVTEEGDKYIVEAELPGVKKENVEVRIEDGGRSVTIEGKVFSRRSGNGEEQRTVEGSASQDASASSTAGEGSQAGMTSSSQQNQLSTERVFTGSSTFTRTVWLPRPVDSSNVSAKLDHGILTVTVPKAQDPESVSIPVQ